MKRTYKVRHPLELRRPTRTYKRGDTVTSDQLAGLNVEALLMSKWLEEVEVEPVPCPACVEQKVKTPAKFKSLDEAREHYADKHAGLAPPDTEEDLTSG